MRIHSLQHVAFEDVGSILDDIHANGHSLTTTHLYKGDRTPELDDIDALIIMGGPMGVYDHDEHPWLILEKEFIGKAIAAGKKAMGICLGAQLIASVLGARVTRNTDREIGWFPLAIDGKALDNPVAKILVECGPVFHWHGDTFEIPPQAQLLASSQACRHQAFFIDNQVYGFQFHLETTEKSAHALIQNCSADLDYSTHVQDAEEIMRTKENFAAINSAMSAVFMHWLNEK